MTDTADRRPDDDPEASDGGDGGSSAVDGILTLDDELEPRPLRSAVVGLIIASCLFLIFTGYRHATLDRATRQAAGLLHDQVVEAEAVREELLTRQDLSMPVRALLSTRSAAQDASSLADVVESEPYSGPEVLPELGRYLQFVELINAIQAECMGRLEQCEAYLDGIGTPLRIMGRTCRDWCHGDG